MSQPRLVTSWGVFDLGTHWGKNKHPSSSPIGKDRLHARKYTAGPKEIQAWTYRQGWLAPKYAGVIHTDFERGFIRPEVDTIPELWEHGSAVNLRSADELREKVRPMKFRTER